MQTISVRSPADIVYVAGVVNGVDVVFDNLHDNVWETEVDRSPNYRYDVTVLMYKESGLGYQYNDVFYEGEFQAVYDRNLLDIQYGREIDRQIKESGFSTLSEQDKNRWLNGNKGYLNYTDLSRIENNCRILAGLLGLNLETKAWEMTDFPVVSDFARIRLNVEQIRAKNYRYPDTPQVPEMPLNRYDKINDIEKILYDAYQLYGKVDEQVYYPNEIYADEQIGVI